MCFGLSAACCKTGIQLIANLGWLAFPAGLIVSILMSSLGFMLQTLGLKDGNTVIVCTCAAVSSMATGEMPLTPLPIVRRQSFDTLSQIDNTGFGNFFAA